MYFKHCLTRTLMSFILITQFQTGIIKKHSTRQFSWNNPLFFQLDNRDKAAVDVLHLTAEVYST